MLYYLLQYSLLLLVCGYLVYHYSGSQVSIHVKLWSVITWVLNFGLALLVPEDVYQTVRQSQSEYLGTQYMVLYWSVYLLTWTIIPVLQYWYDAGDLDSMARLKRSLKSNGVFYLWMLVGAIVALIGLILLKAGGDMGLITFLKCLATIWGIGLLVGLLGYALVYIPKTMWHNAHPKDYLKYLYLRLYQSYEEVEYSHQYFKKVSAFILHLQRSSTDPNILQYCQAALLLVPNKMKGMLNTDYLPFLKQIGYDKMYYIGLESAIEHHRLMRRAIARCTRQYRQFYQYLSETVFYEDVQCSIETGNTLQSKIKTTGVLMTKWYVYWRAKVQKVCAVGLGICCSMLLIAETQVFLGSSWTVLSWLMLINNLQVMRVGVFLVMAFMVYMANYALFRLKLANLYGLYPGASDGASLMFATINFSRIGVALVLNFFDMLKMDNSVYSKVLSTPDMGLLGDWVIKGLPGLLWVVVLTHYFNIWGYLAKKLGIDYGLSFQVHDFYYGKTLKSPYHVDKYRKKLYKYSIALSKNTLIQPLTSG